MSSDRRIQNRPKLGRNPLNLKAISLNEINYFAGYVDGEGCLSINSGSITLKVDSCYPKVCYRLFKCFSGSFRHIKRKDNSGRQRNYFSWKVHGEKAFLVVTALFPFLREKKDQAKLFLKAHHSRGAVKKNEISLKLKELKRIVYL